MAQYSSVEKLYDDKVWIITILNGSRAGVDAWEANVREYIQTVNSPMRYLVYDTTGILNLGFTNYLQQRATVLAHDNRDAEGRVGIVIKVPKMVNYFFETFINVSGKHIQPKLEVKLFNQREEAIAWVSEPIKQGHSQGASGG